jgi:hypothetical protein
MAKNNDVLYTHKGVSVRQLNRVELLIPEPVFKTIIDACAESGFSIHKVLYFSGRPCERCAPQVMVYDKDGQPRMIKKGILNLPESNGINIVQKAKNRKK